MGMRDSSAADFDFSETPFGAPRASGKQNDDAALGSLLHEIYQAVHGGQYRLAAMGIRALLEQIMVSKVGAVLSKSSSMRLRRLDISHSFSGMR